MLNRILGLAVITLGGGGGRFEKAYKIFQADSPLLQIVLETTSPIHFTFCESDPPPHLIAIETTNILATICAEVHRGQHTLSMEPLL